MNRTPGPRQVSGAIAKPSGRLLRPDPGWPEHIGDQRLAVPRRLGVSEIVRSCPFDVAGAKPTTTNARSFAFFLARPFAVRHDAGPSTVRARYGRRHNSRWPQQRRVDRKRQAAQRPHRGPPATVGRLQVQPMNSFFLARARGSVRFVRSGRVGRRNRCILAIGPLHQCYTQSGR